MRVHKLNREIELFITGIGAAQSLYLSIYGLLSRQRDFKSWLLSLFFLAITIRIVKSLLWVYLDHTPLWLINTGFWAHLVTGPLLYLYVFYFINDKKWSHYSLFHFLPALVLLIFISRLTLSNFWYAGGYTALLYHQMIYGGLSLLVFVIEFGRRKKQIGNRSLSTKGWTWIAILVLGIILLQSAYFSNYVLGLTPYLLGPVVYGTFVYFLSFFALKNSLFQRSAINHKKYGNIKLNNSEADLLAVRILDLMEGDKPYKKATFQLKDLAGKLKLPPYLVSHVINKKFSQNFPDFVNTYRIEESKLMLASKQHQSLKISSIAYDCGFNTLSSFNQAFKKQTGTTPSSFRKRMTNL